MRKGIWAVSLLILAMTGCGGGGGDSAAQATATNEVSTAQDVGMTEPTLAQVLTRTPWYQFNFVQPYLGSRTDAIYRFQQLPDGIQIGTRQTINIRGNNVSSFSPLLTNFNWSLNGNVLTINTNSIVGTPVGVETINLVYLPNSDQMEISHDQLGTGIWDGCLSPNRPGYIADLCSQFIVQ